MNRKILNLLEKNARLTNADLATITGLDEKTVEGEIKQMEESGVIRGYKGIVDWESAEPESVSAIIELKVTPTEGVGFERVAERIAKYSEVESVYLTSGACDLIVSVRGKSFHEVCTFLEKEIAVIDSVTSTATKFIMRKYKELGCELTGDSTDERGVLSL